MLQSFQLITIKFEIYYYNNDAPMQDSGSKRQSSGTFPVALQRCLNDSNSNIKSSLKTKICIVSALPEVPQLSATTESNFRFLSALMHLECLVNVCTLW